MSSRHINYALRFLGAITIFASLMSPVQASTAPGTGSLRISGDSFPDFTFQIPIGNLKMINSDEIVNGTAIGLYISTVYQWAVAFAAVLAVLAFSYAGVLWLIAGGDQGKTTESKKIMGNALIGLLLALGSYMFLATLGKDYVNFKPITVRTVSPITLALQQLQLVPATSTIMTRATTTTRTAAPTSVGRSTFTDSCTLECTNRGAARGLTLEPVVTERGGTFDCNCKETATAAECSEPDTELSKQASCSDVCPVGSVINANDYVLGVKNSFPHTAAGAPFYCCSCIVTQNTLPDPAGSKVGVRCAGTVDGDVICRNGLYPVRKTTYTTENKCVCQEGKNGSPCNAETGQGCAPGLTCKKNGGVLWILPPPEDGHCE